MRHDPTSTFEVGSLAGHWTATALFFSIAVVLGWAVSRIAGRLAAPRGQLAYFGTSPVARRVLGVAVAAVLLVVFHAEIWSGWHRADVEPGAVSLRYAVPPRTRVVPLGDVDRIGWEPGDRFSRVLVLTTRDGGSFPSLETSISDEHAAELLARVRATIETRRR